VPYHFLEEMATADIAFEAWGATLEETFTAAADATMNVMVEELDSIEPSQERILALENDQLDLLLLNFLQELIYFKDAEQLMLRVVHVALQADQPPFSLKAIARGELLIPERHHPRVDVKAVTLHEFRLEMTDQGWRAFIILDI
jgi:SHS2 domain-containing protein